MGNEPSSVDGQALIGEFLKHSPFGRLLGIEIKAVEPDTAELTLSFRDELTTAGDVVHGGAISSLLDVAATAAAWAHEFASPPQRWGTASLTVDFLRPAKGRDLEAVARVVRRGRRMCFCQVEARDSDGAVATGLVVYALDSED